ncbi:MAG: TlpA family protein disulfide reductase [Gammaproteobacteria bacterium]|nr:TlpA family protein disulfide reductase [Gammaproteobacteria bacterium]
MRRRYRTDKINYSIFLLAFLLATLLSPLLASQAYANEPLPKGIIKLNGKIAPPLILNDMDEKRFDLTKSRGHWVFVHFWATWCGPCRREMPTIQSMSEKFGNNPQKTAPEIVLINTAESEDTVFNFLGIVAPDLNSLLDTDGLVTEVWQPRGLPATFFVSPDGKLRYLALGDRDWNHAEYIKFLESLK